VSFEKFKRYIRLATLTTQWRSVFTPGIRYDLRNRFQQRKL